MENLVQPFVVNIGELRCRFTPDPEAGGYTVRALNRRGVISQGNTFEEAVTMIQDADHTMREYRAEKQTKKRLINPVTANNTDRAKNRHRVRTRQTASAGV